MAKYLVIIALLVGLNVSAQNDTTKYYSTKDYGWSYRRLQAREALVLPSDTLSNKLGVAVKNGVMYVGNGSSWKASTGGTGGSTDTTSLSTRINGKVSKLGDSIKGSLIVTTAKNAYAIEAYNTALGDSSEDAIYGQSIYGSGVVGVSDSGQGVYGWSPYYVGVEGMASQGIGVVAKNNNTLTQPALKVDSYQGPQADFGNGKVIINHAGQIITGNTEDDNGNTIGDNFIYTTFLNAYTPTNNTALVATSEGGDHANFGNKVIIANSGKITSVDTLIGKAIKIIGGMPYQYLMADGSVTDAEGAGSVTSVAPLTITATGTDITSSVVDANTTPVITLNVPNASATARGVISTGAQTIAGVKTFSPTVSTSGAIARGMFLTPTLNALANNDSLVTLNIAPTHSLGSFTGLIKTAIRIPVDYTSSDYVIRSGATTSNNLGISSTGPIYLQAQNNTVFSATGTNTDIMGRINSSGIRFLNSNGSQGVNGMFAGNTGNFLLGYSADQNTGDKLQVSGSIRATGAVIGTNTRTVITAAGVANATITLADAGLTTPTLAAGTYRFSILIAYNAASTGTGARFVLDGTGSAPTNLSFSMIRPTGASTQQPNFGSAYLFPGIATAASLTTGNICKIEGVITLPTAGTVLSIKFASSTTSAITILAGSYFEYF